MTVGKKWLQYLTALSLSLPVVANASQSSIAPTAKPVTVSAAAAAKLRGYAAATRSASPDAKPNPNPWGQITWIQEGWANWARASAMKDSESPATLEPVPSLAALLDDVKRNA